MNRICLSALIIVLLLQLSGCWDMREINEIGLVMAVGIDISPTDPNKFLVTVQVANPQSSTSGGGGEGQSSQSQVWIASAEGKTIFDAIREIARFSSQRIMWAHNNIIVVSEALAREDITPVLDFFTHNHELRMKTWIAVTPLKAAEIVSSNAGMGNMPGRSVAEVFRFQNLTGMGLPSDLLNVYDNFTGRDTNLLISSLTLNQAVTKPGLSEISKNTVEQLEVSGVAIFDNKKLLGFLSADETRGLSWFMGKNPNLVLSLPHPDNPSKSVALEITQVKAKINSELDQGIPQFTIDISGISHITEEDTTSTMAIDDFKKSLEELAENQITTEVQSSVNRVQKEYRSDVLGFGKTVHVQHKQEWNQGLKTRWVEVFPEASVSVSVKINIESSTLNQTPQRDYKENSSHDQS